VPLVRKHPGSCLVLKRDFQTSFFFSPGFDVLKLWISAGLGREDSPLRFFSESEFFPLFDGRRNFHVSPPKMALPLGRFISASSHPCFRLLACLQSPLVRTKLVRAVLSSRVEKRSRTFLGPPWKAPRTNITFLRTSCIPLRRGIVSGLRILLFFKLFPSPGPPLPLPGGFLAIRVFCSVTLLSSPFLFTTSYLSFQPFPKAAFFLPPLNRHLFPLPRLRPFSFCRFLCRSKSFSPQRFLLGF